MTRPAVEVADILRAQGDRFLDRYRTSFSYQQGKVFRAIRDCRTPALGGHLDACPQCGQKRCDRPPAISYNSCRNRHCPKCQAEARERWLAAREQELLPTGHFHVVFSVPHELNVLALENARLFYELLFTASAAAAIEVARDPKHLGAEIGVLSILHTWGQNLLLHPHIHCVIPMGGLSPQHTRWVHPRYNFFLPVKVLGEVFRGKFLDGLKRLYRRQQLRCGGPASLLTDPKQFARLLRRLHRHDWVVYAKPAMGGPLQVLRYLGRYTHRVAISNHRLVSFDGEHVTFRWKDYAHGSKQKNMTLTATEFLRRFFLHVLPKGFVRIRYFGFLANRWRTEMLALARPLLGAAPIAAIERVPQPSALWRCPQCGARMVILRRFPRKSCVISSSIPHDAASASPPRDVPPARQRHRVSRRASRRLATRSRAYPIHHLRPETMPVPGRLDIHRSSGFGIAVPDRRSIAIDRVHRLGGFLLVS